MIDREADGSELMWAAHSDVPFNLFRKMSLFYLFLNYCIRVFLNTWEYLVHMLLESSVSFTVTASVMYMEAQKATADIGYKM